MFVKKIAAASALCLMMAMPAVAQKWQMPTPYPETSAVTQNVMQFVKEVEETTKGELNITVHTAGSLIKHPEIKNAVRSQQVELGEFLQSTLSNESKIFELDSLPFLVGTFDDAKRLWAAMKEDAQAELARQGVTILFLNPWSPQGLYSLPAIEKVEDLRGGKFRAYNFATERIAQLAGAVPTQVEAADLAQAFSTGRANMMVTSTATGVSAAVWDFLKYFYDVRVSYSTNLVVVNTKALEALKPEVREALLAAAAKAEERGWEMAAEDLEKGKEILASHGVAVSEGSADLRAGLAKIGETMTAEWEKAAGETGAKILAKYRQ